jgi:siroheme synthase-like protein
MPYFPVFLDLKGQPCLVIGRGHLADEKAASLHEAGATVIRSEQFNEEVARASFLLIAVTRDRDLGQRIAQFARQYRILANVLDQTENCNFIFPAVMQQGDLAIAVSSGGKSPLLAVSIRDELKKCYGPEYATLLEILGEIRRSAQETLPRYADRKAFYLALLEAGLLELIRNAGRETTELKVRDVLKKHQLAGAEERRTV